MSKKIDGRRKESSEHALRTAGPRWSADRVRKSDVTRDRLLAALEESLRYQRLAEINVSEVAAVAGVRRTSFYFYFPSKAVAVATALDELSAETFAGAARFMTGSAERLPALRDAFANMWRVWLQHRSLIVAVMDARASDQEAAQIWERWLDRFVSPVSEFITADRTRGLAPEGPDPAVLARLLLSMNERVLERMLRAADLSSDEVDVQLDGLADVWARAIYGHVRDGMATP